MATAIARTQKTPRQPVGTRYDNPPTIDVDVTTLEFGLDADGYVTTDEAADVLAANLQGFEVVSYGYALYVTAETDDAAAVVASLGNKLRALGMQQTNSKRKKPTVHAQATPYSKCPHCHQNIRREALGAHVGTTMCMLGQERQALRDNDYIAAGNTYRTLEKAGVDVHWMASRASLDVSNGSNAPTLGSIDYIRMAPTWAVVIAKVTTVRHELRVVVLEHCLEHLKARKALLAGLKLGPGKTQAQRPNKETDTVAKTKARRTNASRMTGIFEQALRHVG